MNSLVKERTNRESAGSSVYVQSLSGMLGEEQDAARESRDVEDDELHIDDRVLTTGQRFSESAIKSVTRCATRLGDTAVTTAEKRLCACCAAAAASTLESLCPVFYRRIQYSVSTRLY